MIPVIRPDTLVSCGNFKELTLCDLKFSIATGRLRNGDVGLVIAVIPGNMHEINRLDTCLITTNDGCAGWALGVHLSAV